MRVSNNNPNPNKKPLTKNQRIVVIILIILGCLFIVNQFTSRIDQEGQAKAEWQKKYCDQLLAKDIHLYMSEEKCRQ